MVMSCDVCVLKRHCHFVSFGWAFGKTEVASQAGLVDGCRREV